MELLNKPDFDRTLERFEAWWNCEIIDRPPVNIHARPEQPVELPPKHHASLRDRWFDFDYAMDVLEARLSTAVFVGDTFPQYEPKLGPELCASVFRSELEFGEDTTWSVPVADSCRLILDIRPDLDNVYWKAVREATKLSVERGRGRWITAMPDLHTNGDLVAALRNPQDMCLDLALDPDSVREACDYVTEHYPLMFEDLWDLISAEGNPFTTWCPALHAGKTYITNCDMMCMISPRMFEENILPSLLVEMRYLERNLFHLDGPDALRHLDTLLSLPEVNGIQWIYGAGNGPASKWIDVYKRIQSAGKCIELVAEGIDDAKAVAEHLKPEGVWFMVQGGYSRDEAEAFVKWAADWAAHKR